ncbi:MAG: hypothetical protein N2645_05605 [Clostridia bacterium]|nr:hypothetical protein [Clostridia bacterium]
MFKKLVLILTSAILFVTTASCGLDEGKVGVLKGGGMANSSLLVSFKELYSGKVEGFTDNDHVLISEKKGNEYNFHVVDVLSKKKSPLPSMLLGDDYSIEISPDGSKFICNHYLVKVNEQKKTLLTDMKQLENNAPSAFPPLPSYSFTREGEVILVHPLYYAMKFYYGITPGFTPVSSSKLQMEAFMKLGDTKKEANSNKSFKDIKLPEIDYLKSPKLLIDQLKYIFVGYEKDTGKTPLFVFDITDKKFRMIDENISCYALSPDEKNIAFVKNTGKSNLSYVLYTITTDGRDKKEIVRLNSISGISWSPDGKRIAFSGSSEVKNDIWVAKADGSEKEQITNGMVTTENFSWSRSGDKIAFTAGAEEPAVYVITLNTGTGRPINNYYEENPVRREMTRDLLSTLRHETILVNPQKID